MKPKKKTNQIKSTNLIKLMNIKTTDEGEKINKSIKQKTFVTIHENLNTFQKNIDNHDNISHNRRNSFSHNFMKKSYIERMQQNNLSPFSNDGRSVSPKYIRTPEKIIKQQKQIKNTLNNQKKKIKNKISTFKNDKQTKKTQKVNLNLLENKKKVAIVNNNNNNNINIKKKSNRIENDKQQKARIQFQNQFLSMMNKRILNKKITQKSSDQEIDSSIRKKPKLIINIESENNQDQQQKIISKNKKDELVKTMKIKVMRSLQKEYPNLEVNERKVMCAIIIMQRLWRQRKVKQFFQHYVTAKSSPNSSVRESFQKQSNNRDTFNLLHNQLVGKSYEKNMQNQRKQKQYEADFLIRKDSEEELKLDCQRTSTQLRRYEAIFIKKDDSLRSIQNQNPRKMDESDNVDRPSMIRFLQCYRDIRLNKKKTKRNVFSLRQSLSEKCLLQRYYSNLFSDRPEKDQPKNYELFSTFRQGQKSIEILNEINKQKELLVKLNEGVDIKQDRDNQSDDWVRNDTHYNQENDSDELGMRGGIELEKINKIDKSIIVDETEGFSPLTKRKIKEQQPVDMVKLSDEKQTIQELDNVNVIVNLKPQKVQLLTIKQPSIKQIQKVASDLISYLMNEFSQEFKDFTEKKCLTKKKKQKKEQKKPRLPGIEINQESVNNYLNILTQNIEKDNIENIIKSLQMFKSQFYIKCHRAESSIYESFEYDEEYEDEEDEYYWNVVSNQAFFKFEEEFEQRYLKITEDNQKFKNFLELTMKIHNRSLTECFSQLLNKEILQMTVHPWSFFQKSSKTHKNLTFNQNKQQINDIYSHISFSKLIKKVQNKISKQSFLNLGSLRKRDEQTEENKLLKVIHDQYLQQGSQWQTYDESFELKFQLSQFVFEQLMGEFQVELSRFREPILTKSENEIFLQTNQTLETHNI